MYAQTRYLLIAFLATVPGLVLAANDTTRPEPTPSGTAQAARSDQISLDQARILYEREGTLLIDIREPIEHAQGVAPKAYLLPLSQIEQRISEIPTDPNTTVLLICRTQNRSSRLADALHRAGYTHVRFVYGGMSEWAKRGWPLVKPTGS